MIKKINIFIARASSFYLLIPFNDKNEIENIVKLIVD